MDFLQKKLLVLRNMRLEYMSFSSGVFVVTGIETVTAQVGNVPHSATITTMTELQSLFALISSEAGAGSVTVRQDIAVDSTLIDSLSSTCNVTGETDIQPEFTVPGTDTTKTEIEAMALMLGIVEETDIILAENVLTPQVTIAVSIELGRSAMIEDFYGQTIESMSGKPIDEYYYIL